MEDKASEVRVGWGSWLARVGLVVFLFEIITGLAVTLTRFHPVVEWGLLVHTIIGVATLLPLCWYFALHWGDYRSYSFSHVMLLGYVAVVALLVCSLSGLVVTYQGLFGVRMSPLWQQIHLISALVSLATALPHILIVWVRVQRRGGAGAGRALAWASGVTVLGLAAIFGLSAMYSGMEYVNELPEDYEFVYGEDRPFAPSLARTTTNGAFDARSLSGSETCGSSGCHEQILSEWQASSHRWSAMDAAFQKIQSVMAEQNGPGSTRYCGGCHDPISLFSGTKNIFVENLTSLQGYNEGVSCLSCHSIKETDLQGNANYVMAQPTDYLWQWSEGGAAKLASNFLIRTYPEEHNRLSKRAFKTPEYCAACHKQFIDQEVNRVGWVQLQNQYDNWKASRWFHEGDPTKTVECRECHMPLMASNDPASGDSADYNRSADDGKHRSHRFIASNNMMPAVLKVEGWEKQVELTEQWLQGKYEIPEIADKWASGPIVTVALDVPETVKPGATLPIRVVMTSNKVGHDFPTGPLDIIQGWLEVHVTDDDGNTVFASGRRDEKHFIEPGSFLFKVEPVDQYGNLIDRHNLWEMVGVRFRRALFPGYSDTVEFQVGCPSTMGSNEAAETNEVREDVLVPAGKTGENLHVLVKLNYRKVDQFLLNYMFGEDSGLTAPPVELARANATVRVTGNAG